MSCNCQVCQDITRWKSIFEGDDVTARMDAFAEMFSRIENAETDVAWYQSIFEGSWPNAEQILEQQLNFVRNKNATGLPIPPQPADPTV